MRFHGANEHFELRSFGGPLLEGDEALVFIDEAEALRFLRSLAADDLHERGALVDWREGFCVEPHDRASESHRDLGRLARALVQGSLDLVRVPRPLPATEPFPSNLEAERLEPEPDEAPESEHLVLVASAEIDDDWPDLDTDDEADDWPGLESAAEAIETG